MTDVEVRRVAPEDWRAYRDIRLAMLLDTPRAFGSTYAETAQRSDVDWQTFVAQAHLWLAYVCWQDREAEPVGSIGMYAAPELAPGSVSLVGMWVAPTCRRRGVGTALVETMWAAARAEGFDRVVLEVADENAEAAGLYRRLGFAPTGVAGSIPWDDSITESQMARDLVPE